MYMNLDLPFKYEITQKPIRPYRDLVTVAELQNEEPVREWSEPFDPVRGDIDELKHRLLLKITGESDVVLSGDRNILSSSDLERWQRVFMPILNSLCAGISSNVKAMEDDKFHDRPVSVPEQVFTEQELNHAFDMIVKNAKAIVNTETKIIYISWFRKLLKKVRLCRR